MSYTCFLYLHAYDMHMESSEKQLTVKMPIRDYELLMACVKKGYAINITDFIRRAIREKCDDIGVQVERDKTAQVVFAGG